MDELINNGLIMINTRIEQVAGRAYLKCSEELYKKILKRITLTTKQLVIK